MMRFFLMFVVAAGLFQAGASSQAEGPDWEYPAHSYYNGDPSYDYRVTVYYEVSTQEGEFKITEYDYSGPVTIEPGEWYRWDRNLHQVELEFDATNVFGVVENRYGGAGPWYHIDLIQYVESD